MTGFETKVSAAALVGELTEARALMDDGQVELAIARSHEVLQMAEATGDLLTQAHCYALLAQADRLVSKFRLSLVSSQRAAQHFQLCGDVLGEAGALATQSYAAISLGHNEEAVEAAMLAVRLTERLPPSEQLASAHNNLGIAYFWSKDFQRASASFESAMRVVEAVEHDGLTTQVLLNIAAAETASAFHARYEDESLPSMDRLSSALTRLDRQIARGNAFKFSDGLQVTGKALHCYFAAMRSCWTGDTETAKSLVKQAYWWKSKYGVKTWLDVLASWCSAEISWAEHRLDSAVHLAQETVDLAVQIEHEQLGTIGRLLLCQLYQAQGDQVSAQREMKALRRREDENRIEGLRSRALAVSWHVDMRQNAHNLRAMEIGARNLERLSNEDGLTGLANRRLFERRARDLLAAENVEARPLCIVLIDVDKFKTVNDTHSHAVGDTVLKTIADILKSNVRDCDVAARLAGDEFVLALANLELSEAEQVCQRVCESVRNFPWSEVATDLSVTLSAGLSQASKGEAFEELLHRSDMEMYSSKRSKGPESLN